MYWLSLSGAKRDLRSGNLSSRTLLPYVLAFGAFESLSISMSALAPGGPDPELTDLYLALVSVGITVLGLLHVYRKNGGVAGQNFVERLLVIGWVTGIHFMAAAFAAIALLGVLLMTSSSGQALIDSFAPFFVLVSGAYYVYLGRHVADVGNDRPPTDDLNDVRSDQPDA